MRQSLAPFLSFSWLIFTCGCGVQEYHPSSYTDLMRTQEMVHDALLRTDDPSDRKRLIQRIDSLAGTVEQVELLKALKSHPSKDLETAIEAVLKGMEENASKVNHHMEGNKKLMDDHLHELLKELYRRRAAPAEQ